MYNVLPLRLCMLYAKKQKTANIRKTCAVVRACVLYALARLRICAFAFLTSKETYKETQITQTG